MSQPMQPDLAAVDLGIGIFQVRLAVAQALDLGSGQDEPRLDLFQQLVSCRARRFRATILIPDSSAFPLVFSFRVLLGHLNSVFSSRSQEEFRRSSVSTRARRQDRRDLGERFQDEAPARESGMGDAQLGRVDDRIVEE